jgi:hypothetical protein
MCTVTVALQDELADDVKHLSFGSLSGMYVELASWTFWSKSAADMYVESKSTPADPLTFREAAFSGRTHALTHSRTRSHTYARARTHTHTHTPHTRYLAKWTEVADDDRAAEAFTGIFPKKGPGGEVTYLVLNVGTCQQFVDLYGEGNAYHLIEESKGVKFADQKASRLPR